jgi:hypothetical protein
MHARLGIARRQQRVRAAVTVDAIGGIIVSAFDGLGMEAALVGSLLVGVAGGARDPLRRSFMRGVLYVRVAIHTSEHAAVDGIFERLRIDVQANRLALYLVRQSRIAMAGETFVACRLGRVFLRRSMERARR